MEIGEEKGREDGTLESDAGNRSIWIGGEARISRKSVYIDWIRGWRPGSLAGRTVTDIQFGY